MKKIIFIAVLAISGSVYGQVSQGSMFLGGSVGFWNQSSKTTIKATSTTTDNPGASYFEFRPEFGYFVTDRIAAGLMLDFSSDVWNKTDSTKNKTGEFGVSIFGRYYAPINDKFYFWGQLDLGMGSSKTEVTMGGTTKKAVESSSFGFGISPGFSYFPSTRYGFNFGVGRLGMSSSKNISNPGETTETTVKTSNFVAAWDMRAITFGITVFFGGGGATAAN